MRPHLRDRAGDAGALSRLHFRRQPAAAICMGQGALPLALRGRQTAGRRRAVGGAGGDVGRIRHQRPQRRVADPADPLRQALLPRGVRQGAGVSVAAGCVRLQRVLAAAAREIGCAPFHDAKTVMELGDAAPASYVLVAGYRRLGGAGAYAAGRHLQQLRFPRRAGESRRALYRQGGVGQLPDAVRHRRRRRRPGRRTSRTPGARKRPRRFAAGRAAPG